MSALHLDVYDGRGGWWNPEHDVVALPEGWHQQLAELNPFVEDDDRYRAIKAQAHDAVDNYLDAHRQQLP